jgi:hypothetical protein
MTNLICYCFGYSAADIQDDVIAHDGHSLILERILKEKKAGSCQCATVHPRGR